MLSCELPPKLCKIIIINDPYYLNKVVTCSDARGFHIWYHMQKGGMNKCAYAISHFYIVQFYYHVHLLCTCWVGLFTAR